MPYNLGISCVIVSWYVRILTAVTSWMPLLLQYLQVGTVLTVHAAPISACRCLKHALISTMNYFQQVERANSLASRTTVSGAFPPAVTFLADFRTFAGHCAILDLKCSFKTEHDEGVAPTGSLGGNSPTENPQGQHSQSSICHQEVSGIC